MALLDSKTELRIKQVINTVESGTPTGDYSAISIYNDGKGQTKQITYGCSQTTEQGNLKKLIQRYIAMSGKYASDFAPYLDKIGLIPLWQDTDFIAVLKSAGKEQIMRDAQDGFFNDEYFEPSIDWADINGFVLPLSKLVIYDSFIQSGHILQEIRNQFAEKPPAQGGNEKYWIMGYLRCRKAFLLNSVNKDVNKSIYRVLAYQKALRADNWDLSQPVSVEGFSI